MAFFSDPPDKYKVHALIRLQLLILKSFPINISSIIHHSTLHSLRHQQCCTTNHTPTPEKRRKLKIIEEKYSQMKTGEVMAIRQLIGEELLTKQTSTE
jgi:hypothetical protein